MEHDATDHGPMRILNPTMRQPEEDGKLAPRLDTLDGKTVGILGNGFPGADRESWNKHAEGASFLRSLRYVEMMTRVEEILWERFDLKGTVVKQKAYFGEPAPSETVEELVDSCDAVFTAIGA